MACCGGGSSKRSVRSASVVSAHAAPKPPKTPAIRKITRQRNAATPASTTRMSKVRTSDYVSTYC